LAESVALVSIPEPHIVQGTAIKTNNNQRYATNAETGFLLRELARRAGVPVQVGQLTSSQGWKKPGFLKKKTSPVGFFVFFGFFGFFWVFWVFLAQKRGF
jgi:hypothetical protein